MLRIPVNKIKRLYPSSLTGTYWINKNNPIKVVCEMETDGGKKNLNQILHH